MVARAFSFAFSSSSVRIPFETSRAIRASSRDVVSTVAFRRVVAFSSVGDTFSETKVLTCLRSFLS